MKGKCSVWPLHFSRILKLRMLIISKHRIVPLLVGMLFGGILSVSLWLFVAHSTNSKLIQDGAISVQLTEKNQAELVLLNLMEIPKLGERRRAIYGVASGLDQVEIADLLSETKALSSVKNLSSVQTFLMEALAYAAPELALESVWKFPADRQEQLFHIVMSVWSITDITSAVDMATRISRHWRNSSIESILQQRPDLPPSLLSNLSKSGSGAMLVDQIGLKAQINQLISKPKEALSLVLQSSVSDFSKAQLLSGLAKQWYAREGGSSVRVMLDIMIEEVSDNLSLLTPIVDEVVSLDPQLGWQYFLSRPSDERSALIHGVSRAMLGHDPLFSINTINQLGSDQLVFRERQLFFYTWARLYPGEVIDNLQHIPPDSRANILELVVPQLLLVSNPEVVLKKLGQLELQGESTKRAKLVLLRTWSRNDPVAAVTWHLENNEASEAIFQSSVRVALERLVLYDKEQAMDLAHTQPVESRIDELVVRSLLRYGKLDEGLALLPRVRETSSITEFYANVGGVLVEADRVAEAIQLATRLAEEDRESYFRRLADIWRVKDIDSLLVELENIPNPTIRDSIARDLLELDGSFSPSLTQNERETLNLYLIGD